MKISAPKTLPASARVVKGKMQGKMAASIPWNSERLVIRELQDGDNRVNEEEACVKCHTGNNVFLMSPDDPVWGRVMRGPLRLGTFTTRIESSPGNPDLNARYTPVGTRWVNPPPPPVGVCGIRELDSPICSSSCHYERVNCKVGGFWMNLRNQQPMPPMCSSSVEGCYGTP